MKKGTIKYTKVTNNTLTQNKLPIKYKVIIEQVTNKRFLENISISCKSACEVISKECVYNRHHFFVFQSA